MRLGFYTSLLLLILLISCKKDDDTKIEPEEETNNLLDDVRHPDQIYAMIDDVEWSTGNISGSKAFVSVIISGDVNDSEGNIESTIYLDLPLDPKSGTYDLGEDSEYGARFFGVKGNLDTYETKNNSGTITIDEITLTDLGNVSTAKGSFSGFGYNSSTGKTDSISITEGYFSFGN